MMDGSHCFAEKTEEAVVHFTIAQTETSNAIALLGAKALGGDAFPVWPADVLPRISRHGTEEAA